MSNYFYEFPSIRGKQSNREYFVIMCPMDLLDKIFIFHNNDLPLEFRAQRRINESRIPEMTKYILENKENYVFSSVTASLDGNYKFYSNDKQDKNIGVLKISMDSKLLINDGQHRLMAIREAIKSDDAIKHETISVVLFIDEDLKRSQQMFADLNKHAINISKSIGILYDSRDPIAILSKEIVFNVKNLKKFTDLENISLSKNSNKLFLLSNIYNTNERILKNLNIEKFSNEIHEFWDYYLNSMDDFKFVVNKETSPKYFRQELILSYGTVMEAIGEIVNGLLISNNLNYDKLFEMLNKIDWSRSNKEWTNRVFNINGRIVKNSNYIRLTKILIMKKIGLEISGKDIDFETNSMEDR